MKLKLLSAVRELLDVYQGAVFFKQQYQNNEELFKEIFRHVCPDDCVVKYSSNGETLAYMASNTLRTWRKTDSLLKTGDEIYRDSQVITGLSVVHGFSSASLEASEYAKLRSE